MSTMQRFDDEQLLMDYLLGSLPEREELELEAHYLADAPTFEHLAAIEDQLIDAYILNGLSADQRRRFEEYFLNSPRRVEKLRAARHLLGAVTHASSSLGRPRRKVMPLDRFLLLTACLATAGVAIFLVHRLQVTGSVAQAQQIQISQRLEQVLTELEAERRHGTDLQQKLEAERIARPVPLFAMLEPPGAKSVTYRLSPERLRGEPVSVRFPIPAKADWIRLEVRLQDSGGSQYYVDITTAEGRKIWSIGPLRARAGAGAASLVVSIPKNQLEPQDYLFTVQRVVGPTRSEVVGKYAFSMSGER